MMSADARNILYLCADPGIPVGGRKGASVHIHEFVRAMRDSGRQVTVVASRLAPGETEDGDRLYLIPPPLDGSPAAARQPDAARRVQRELRSVMYNAEVTARLEHIVARTAVDLVYERYALFSSAGLAFSRRHGLPHILEVNAPLAEEAHRYRTLLSRDLAATMEACLFSGAHHVIAVSEPLAQYIEKQAPNARISVVPNGVNLERFASPPTSVRKGLTGGSQVSTIGFVGTVRPWHGVHILLDAFARLPRQERGITLRIIGDHRAHQKELDLQCAELGLGGQVEFTGAVDPDRIPAMLAELDIVVAPYPDMENFYFSPLKIYEYMAAGKTIVASSIGQINDVLDHDINALLVPPGDALALSRALLRAVRDDELRQRLGAQACADARHKHGWSRRIETVSAILDDELRRQRDLKESCHALEV